VHSAAGDAGQLVVRCSSVSPTAEAAWFEAVAAVPGSAARDQRASNADRSAGRAEPRSRAWRAAGDEAVGPADTGKLWVAVKGLASSGSSASSSRWRRARRRAVVESKTSGGTETAGESAQIGLTIGSFAKARGAVAVTFGLLQNRHDPVLGAGGSVTYSVFPCRPFHRPGEEHASTPSPKVQAHFLKIGFE
jgi:hypothetical protein